MENRDGVDRRCAWRVQVVEWPPYGIPMVLTGIIEYSVIQRIGKSEIIGICQ